MKPSTAGAASAQRPVALPCGTHSEAFDAADLQAFQRHVGPLGIADLLYVTGLDATMTGVVLGAPLSQVGRLHPTQGRSLARVAAHVAAGYRMRRALATPSAEAHEAEAVLTPGGRAVHADGQAKERRFLAALAEAVRASERARGRLRTRAPHEAVALWRALVAGRWSLVERCDRDGKRFLLARKNVPEVHEPGALAPAERRVAALLAMGHSQKLVSYELGLGAAAVSQLARAALRKLGVRSRSELVVLFGSQAGG